MFFFLVICQLMACCLATEAFPAIFASVRLIPGLHGSITHSSQLPYTLHESNELLSRAFEQCIDDAFVIFNVPGLEVLDFGNFTSFKYLRDFMTRTSTLISMPNILTDGATLDVDLLRELTEIHCNAKRETIRGMEDSSIINYVDARPRFIEVDMPALNYSSGTEERAELLRHYDEYMYKVVRELPSPRIALLFTTNTTSPVDLDVISSPDIIRESQLADDPRVVSINLLNKVKDSPRVIFPDITVFDKSRYYDYERNEHGELEDEKLEKHVASGESWLEKKKKNNVEKDKSMYRFGEEDDDTSSIFDDADFLGHNALLIFGVIVILSLVVGWDLLRSLYAFIRSFGAKPKTE